MTTKIAIAGAKGRMGQNLIRSGLSNPHTDIVGVFDISVIDQDFLKEMNLPNNLAITRESSFEVADVIIDFHHQKRYLLLLRVLLRVIRALLLERRVLSHNISIS